MKNQLVLIAFSLCITVSLLAAAGGEAKRYRSSPDRNEVVSLEAVASPENTESGDMSMDMFCNNIPPVYVRKAVGKKRRDFAESFFFCIKRFLQGIYQGIPIFPKECCALPIFNFICSGIKSR